MKTERLLRAFLWLGAVTWGCAGVGVFLPWELAEDGLQGLGMGDVPYDNMLDYWLRMASGAFALVGMLFAVCALWPRRFVPIIPWLAVLMIVEGSILTGHGMRLGLAGFPFYGDITACFVTGIGILWCARRTGSRGSNDQVASPEFQSR